MNDGRPDHEDVLRAALREAVDGASLGRLDAHLGAMQGRARRRRAAKKAGIGATTLCVVGALGIAVAQLPNRVVPDPVPPATSESPTDDPTGPTDPTEPTTDDPTTTPTTEPPVQDGYVPPWLTDTPYTCGMAAADLAASTTPLRLDATATFTRDDAGQGVVYARFPVTVANTSDAAIDGYAPEKITVAWVQDGRVVNFGQNESETAGPFAVSAGGTVEGEAVANSTSYCAPDASGEFHEKLPAGDYELVAYQWVSPDVPYDVANLIRAVGTPVPVTLGDDGTVAARTP